MANIAKTTKHNQDRQWSRGADSVTPPSVPVHILGGLGDLGRVEAFAGPSNSPPDGYFDPTTFLRVWVVTLTPDGGRHG